MDRLLLQTLKFRDKYEELVPGLPEAALNPKTMVIVKAFGVWFKKTDTQYIDIEDFKVFFFNFHTKNEPEKVQYYYNALLEKCRPDPDPSVMNLMSEQLVKLSFATQVANLLEQWNDGEEVDILDEIGMRHSSAVEKLSLEEEDYHVQTSIEEILAVDEYDIGLRFGLSYLRHGIRPLQSGDFVIAAGRPDSGKTTFITSNLCSFIRDLPDERDVLWFNNEGEGNRIIKRIYQSALKSTTEDLLQGKRDGSLHQRYVDALGRQDRVRVIDCHSWNTFQVDRAIKKYNPGLVIFDMIDNITFTDISKKARTDEVLERMYQWARVLGVKYDFPVIATSQVSGEAEREPETQMWPQQSMLKDSKTGKQGAADLIIMIGKSNDPNKGDRRYISTPKNKLAKGESYLRFECSFDGKRAQYADN